MRKRSLRKGVVQDMVAIICWIPPIGKSLSIISSNSGKKKKKVGTIIVPILNTERLKLGGGNGVSWGPRSRKDSTGRLCPSQGLCFPFCPPHPAQHSPGASNWNINYINSVHSLWTSVPWKDTERQRQRKTKTERRERDRECPETARPPLSTTLTNELWVWVLRSRSSLTKGQNPINPPLCQIWGWSMGNDIDVAIETSLFPSTVQEHYFSKEAVMCASWKNDQGFIFFFFFFLFLHMTPQSD